MKRVAPESVLIERTSESWTKYRESVRECAIRWLKGSSNQTNRRT
jgi:hypothetical protein